VRDFTNDHSALALNTATLGHNLDGYGAGWSAEQVIDACAARGYGGITFWCRELGNRAQSIGERVRTSGMQVAGLCRTPYFTGSQAGTDDEIRFSIEMAAQLGSRVLTIVTGGTDPQTKGTLESQKRLSDRLSRAAEWAGEVDVSLALEPLNPMFGGNRTCIMTVADALNVCDMVDSAYLGIAVDVYHVWWDNTLHESLGKARHKILGYHLCDWLEDTHDMLLDRGMMGDGVADLKAIRKSVEMAGYAGLCEVEIFSAHNWWQKPVDDVLDEVLRRFRQFA